MKALWDHGRAYCGRDGCRNRDSLARRSDCATVWVGDRWSYDETYTRFVHADRRIFSLRAAGQTARERGPSRRVELPAVFVCPICGTPNEVDEP